MGTTISSFLLLTVPVFLCTTTKKTSRLRLDLHIKCGRHNASMRTTNDSAAENSKTEWLLQQALNKAKSLGASTELIKLKDYKIMPCKGCYSTTNTQCHFLCSCYQRGEFGDDMTNKLYQKILDADGIIFATPVHNFKISSLMALFLDRLISMDGSLSSL